METIEYNGLRLAVFISKSDFQKGLTFCSEDKDFIQAGIWNYDKGKDLAVHVHNNVPRTITKTQEVICVLEGMVEALIYTEDAQLVKKLVVQKGDVLILLNGGHGYKILADNTFVLEVKNGPYLGAETDRRRLFEVNKQTTNSK
jgi:hypothetical protein